MTDFIDVSESEERAWLNKVNDSGVLDLFDRKSIASIRSFISFLNSEKCSLKSVSQTSLKSLVNQRSIMDDVLSWMIRAINDNPDSSCVALSLHNSFCEGKLREDILEYIDNLEKSKVDTLVLFVNVGRDLKTRDTYLSFMYDENNRYIEGSHYSLAVIEIENAKCYYCDSSGWDCYSTFQDDVHTSLGQIRNLLGLPEFDEIILYKVHNPQTTPDEPTRKHTCVKSGNLSGYIPCATFYPFQTCSTVCGVVVVICAAIAAFDFPSFASLVTAENDQPSRLSYLRDPTKNSDFLRLVIIKWFMEGKVCLDDLLRIQSVNTLAEDDDDDILFTIDPRKFRKTTINSSSKKASATVDVIDGVDPGVKPGADVSLVEVDERTCDDGVVVVDVQDDAAVVSDNDVDADEDDGAVDDAVAENEVGGDVAAGTDNNEVGDDVAAAGVSDDGVDSAAPAPSLWTMTSINSSLELKTLLGFKWKYLKSTKSTNHKNNKLTKSRTYVCVETTCQAEYKCSAEVKRNRAKRPYERSFKFIKGHTCGAEPNRELIVKKKYNFNKGKNADFTSSDDLTWYEALAKQACTMEVGVKGVTAVADIDEGESANVADVNQDGDVNVAVGDEGVTVTDVHLNQGLTVMDGVDQGKTVAEKVVVANVADVYQDQIVTEVNRDLRVADEDEGVTVMDGVDQGKTVAEKVVVANVADVYQDQIVTEVNRDLRVADEDEGVTVMDDGVDQGKTVAEKVVVVNLADVNDKIVMEGNRNMNVADGDEDVTVTEKIGVERVNNAGEKGARTQKPTSVDEAISDDLNSSIDNKIFGSLNLSAIVDEKKNHVYDSAAADDNDDIDFDLNFQAQYRKIQNSTMIIRDSSPSKYNAIDQHSSDDSPQEDSVLRRKVKSLFQASPLVSNVGTHDNGDQDEVNVNPVINSVSSVDLLGPFIIAELAQLPFTNPISPAMYFFPGLGNKVGRGRKYDTRTLWGQGSNRGVGPTAVTRYSCNYLNDCSASRTIWVCFGSCRRGDLRCCQEHAELNCGPSLVIKYMGQHGCTIDTNMNDSAQIGGFKSVIGKTLLETAQNKFRGCNVTEVDSIPDELDGNQLFVLRCSEARPGQKLQKLINDGRSYLPMERGSCSKMAECFGHEKKSVVVYLFKCKGTLICKNDACKMKQRWGLANQITTPSGGIKSKCSSCDADLHEKPCHVKKYVAYINKVNVGDEGNPILVKYENGEHLCLAKYKVQETAVQEFITYFKQNPNVPPSVAFSNILSRKILTDAPNKEIHDTLMLQIQPWIIGNAKATAKGKKKGIADIIEEFKEKFVTKRPKLGLVLEYHPFSVYCISCNKVVVHTKQQPKCECGSEGIPTGRFIFLTSQEAMNTMDQMGPDKSLYGRSCHVDHQPSRTKEFTTFEGVTYDPNLCQVAHLFTFHMDREEEFHVSAAFSHVKGYMRNSKREFKPHGFVRDGANSLKNAITREFGSSSIRRVPFQAECNSNA